MVQGGEKIPEGAAAPLFIAPMHYLLVGAQKYYLSWAQGTLATPLIAVD